MQTFKLFIKVSIALFILTFSIKYIIEIFQLKDLSIAYQELNLILFIAFNTPLLIFYWIVRTLRLKYLLDDTSSTIPFLKLLQINTFAITTAMFTPFQSGEALKIAMLNDLMDYNIKKITAVFVIEKIQDFFILTLMFIVGLLSFQQRDISRLEISHFLILSFVFFALALISVYFFKYQAKKKFFISFVLSSFSWFIMCFVWLNTLKSVSLELDFMHIVFTISSITFVQIFSFIPMGIGIAEVTIFKLFLSYGITNEMAKVATLNLRLMGLYSIILGYILYTILKVYNASKN